MCGIYGLVDLNNPVDLFFLKKQCDLLSHRGPDSSGVWLSESQHVAFAHRRLSIIDLSPAGHQPMVSTDGRLAVVFNGEVYNFQDLREELKKAGYNFRSSSDTEVVLASYQAWGDECIKRFNGMFALAIYDRGDNNTTPCIFFARDRVGKKPLYYKLEERSFQFASELKAIDISSGIDITALNYYLALGYVPGELCLAKGVRKLPPAHVARLDLTNLKLKIWQYWDIPLNVTNPDANGEELASQIKTLLMDAVRLRLKSDVPLGILLSGGIDSSLIVAFAVQQSSQQVKTFTISLPGNKLDEASYAQRVANHFHTDHHVLEVHQSTLSSMIEDLVPYVDEPIADSSLILIFMISKLIREHVTVALGGDGGDELFGGYTHYLTALSDQEHLGWVPIMLLRAIGKLAGYLPAGVKGRNRLNSLQEGALQQMIWNTPYFDVELRRRIFTKEQLKNLGSELGAPERWLLNLYTNGFDVVDRMTRTNFYSILSDDFMVKVDRASMANSLEIRSPFLDYRLVEFAFSHIPSHWKVSNGETRRIQRILAKEVLPSDLNINRKQGFSLPMDDWLRADNCQIIRKYMCYLPKVINQKEVEKLITGHMCGRANGSRLFALLMLGIAMKNNKW